jgi:hypothetical protein
MPHSSLLEKQFLGFEKLVLLGVDIVAQAKAKSLR